MDSGQYLKRHGILQMVQIQEELDLKEDDGSYDGEGGKHHVVDGRDDGSVEQVQCLVQIVHLCHHTDAHQLHVRNPI